MRAEATTTLPIAIGTVTAANADETSTGMTAAATSTAATSAPTVAPVNHDRTNRYPPSATPRIHTNGERSRRGMPLVVANRVERTTAACAASVANAEVERSTATVCFAPSHTSNCSRAVAGDTGSDAGGFSGTSLLQP